MNFITDFFTDQRLLSVVDASGNVTEHPLSTDTAVIYPLVGTEHADWIVHLSTDQYEYWHDMGLVEPYNAKASALLKREVFGTCVLAGPRIGKLVLHQN